MSDLVQNQIDRERDLERDSDAAEKVWRLDARQSEKFLAEAAAMRQESARATADIDAAIAADRRRDADLAALCQNPKGLEGVLALMLSAMHQHTKHREGGVTVQRAIDLLIDAGRQ